MNRVVITGMGIYSTIGKNLEEVRDSLYRGKSGIGFDPERKKMGFRSALTGIIERPRLKGILPRRNRVGLPGQGEYAFMATAEALKRSGIDEEFLNMREVGILYGNDSSAAPVVESVDILRLKKDTSLLGSGFIFQSMNSTVSMNLAVIFGLKGVNFTVSGACASGAHALGVGFMMIRHGYQDCIVCGGAQEINAVSMGSFDGLGAFSVDETVPEKASKPFDAGRDGLVPSGGAATVILESYDSAVRRGAPIFGEILGYGFSSNGYHISVPRVEGPTGSMERALKDAGLKPGQIDYVNAHATSTPLGDAVEAQALVRVFGERSLPVSSTKSMTGHEMWMGGASEIIYSLLMAGNDFMAPNINFKEPDEHSEKLDVIIETREAPVDIFLSNSFGFGGTNSTLIVKNYR